MIWVHLLILVCVFLCIFVLHDWQLLMLSQYMVMSSMCTRPIMAWLMDSVSCATYGLNFHVVQLSILVNCIIIFGMGHLLLWIRTTQCIQFKSIALHGLCMVLLGLNYIIPNESKMNRYLVYILLLLYDCLHTDSDIYTTRWIVWLVCSSDPHFPYCFVGISALVSPSVLKDQSMLHYT